MSVINQINTSLEESKGTSFSPWKTLFHLLMQQTLVDFVIFSLKHTSSIGELHQ